MIEEIANVLYTDFYTFSTPSVFDGFVQSHVYTLLQDFFWLVGWLVGWSVGWYFVYGKTRKYVGGSWWGGTKKTMVETNFHQMKCVIEIMQQFSLLSFGLEFLRKRKKIFVFTRIPSISFFFFFFATSLVAPPFIDP